MFLRHGREFSPTFAAESQITNLLKFNEMTKYYYKDKEISHLDFLRMMREIGLSSGYRVSHYEHLRDMVDKGNEKAIALLADMRVEE